ncbi:SpoIIE family protein phosphatase [Streptomyces tropicalis]|uniref:SpoIIE family protein phosphatase n=1 Tax=Streptomyces tropicalis TaxID=3034234 RepID=A0ABT6A571_9ACTN|nr:SpoIIE family protein phosphatase [Streptomyces tropicalis]MDF3299511.1 SpoIIE family protein phosphatase [Streptomyces tropicalis]
MAQADPRRHEDETAASMLEALFADAPIGLYLLDPQLRVVRVNTATPALQDPAASDLAGRAVRDLYDMVDAEALERRLREVLDTGVPLRERIVQARLRSDPGRAHHFEVTALRLDNPDGAVLGVAVTAVDVTERERSRARARVLDAVRRRVGRTQDPVVTGEEFVGAVVPGFADIAVVEVVDAVIRGDEPPLAPLPPGTPLMRTSFRSSRPCPPQAHPVGDVRRLPSPTPFTQALTDLRPRVVPLHADEPWMPVDAPRTDAMRSSRSHSLLVVPMALRDAALGLISLYRTEESPPFDDHDRRLAVELAAHTALCVDNARRYVREHTLAAMVQRRLLPRSPETHASLETAYLSVTGADPGAWYDTIALSGARTALVVGNVSGRGLEAAAAMGQLRTVVRALAAFDLAPDELLARLHDTAAGLASERARLPVGDPLRRERLDADCAYAVHEPLTGTCVMAAAGRLAPVVVRPDRTVTVPDTPSGPRLGTAGDSPFAAVTFSVPHGSLLVFTSNPALTAYLAEHSQPLRAAPDFDDRPLQELCDTLVYELPDSLGAGDAAVIVARTRSFAAGEFATWRLDPDPTAVAVARGRARRQLTAWNIDEETAFHTQVIVSELVTNAVRYGAPPIELRLIHDRTLTCEVSDSGSAAPHLRYARTADEGGRGLFIAAQLAQSWGTRYTPDGKTVWTEQALPARQD